MDSQTERQKHLIREYKKQPKKIGAYCIRNTTTQKCYVGVSVDIEARLNRHRFALKTSTEILSAELQTDWNKLGAECFEFSTLDMIEPPADSPNYDPDDDLKVLEQLWIEQLNSAHPNGYNPQ